MQNHRLGVFGVCTLSLFAVTHCGDSGDSDSGAGGSGNQAGLHASGGNSVGAGGSTPSGAGSGALAGGGADSNGGAPSETGGGAGGDSDAAGLGGAPAAGHSGTQAGGVGDGGALCAPDPPPAEGTVYDGDLALESGADIDAARSYSRITGCLTLDVAAGEVSLPNLVSIGSLHAQSSALTRLSLPNVQTIDGELWVYLNGSLTALDLRRLEEVGGRFYIHRNIALSDLQLISLRSVHGSTTNFDTDSEITGNIRLPACLLDVPKARFQTFAFTSGVPTCSCSVECDYVSVDGC